MPDRRAWHYDEVEDKGNNEYERFYSFLDNRFSYSCNRWFDKNGQKIAQTNSEATVNKWLEYARRLGFRNNPNKSMLEIGFGFGGFSKWVKGRYDFNVDALNVSRQQTLYAKRDPQNVNFIEKSWEQAEVKNKYDYIVSEGVLVHQRNKHRFFRYIQRALKPRGKALVREMFFVSGNELDKAVCKGLNSVYANSGSYFLLSEAEEILNELGITYNIVKWDISNYKQTQLEWLDRMRSNKIEMKDINNSAWKERMLNFHLFIKMFDKGAFEMVNLILDK